MVDSRCAIAIVVRLGHQHVQRVADDQLGFGVDARRGLVENQDARIEGQRARERQQLLLPDRQRRAALGDRARVAVRQPLDERLGVHRARRAAHALVVDRRVAEADVVGDRAREQVHVLQHQAEQPAHVGEIELADVDAVDRDPAARHVVEPQQQVDQRRLARAGGADDADALAGADLEADVLEHQVVVVVGEPDVVEARCGPAPGAGRRAGARRRLDRHRLVEQLEDPLGRGHRRLQDVELLRHVADRPEEALRVLQEGDERAERQRPVQRRCRRRTR